MERSKHWRIHYGPEAYEEEAYSVLDIINIRLNRLARKLDGTTIGCEAHVQIRDFEWYTWYHVMALIKFEQPMPEQELREHLLAVCVEVAIHPPLGTTVSWRCCTNGNTNGCATITVTIYKIKRARYIS